MGKNVEEYAKGYDRARRWTAQQQAQAEVDRLAKAINLVAGAAAVPRRLGAEATPEEMAEDKRIAKSLLHQQRSLLRLWRRMGNLGDGVAVDPDEKAARAGARVDWNEWRQDQEAELLDRRGTVAATLVEDDPQLGNRFAHLYDRELAMLDHVFGNGTPP